MEDFQREVLLELSPAKEAALSERVREMLRVRGQSNDVVSPIQSPQPDC